MFAPFERFLRDESAATAIEYGLIAALVSVAAIGALQAVGTQLANVFWQIDSVLTSTHGG